MVRRQNGRQRRQPLHHDVENAPIDDIQQALSDNPNTNNLNKSLAVDPASFHVEPGLFTDRRSLNITLPAIMDKDTSGNPYAAAGAGMAASMISLHLELRSPGTVASSNGDMTRDGFVRWNVGLTNPTPISYVVQAPNLGHILIAVLAAIILGIGTILVIGRRKAGAAPKPASAIA